jgi:hypothetical protein
MQFRLSLPSCSFGGASLRVLAPPWGALCWMRHNATERPKSAGSAPAGYRYRYIVGTPNTQHPIQVPSVHRGGGGYRHARGWRPSARQFILPQEAAAYAAGPGRRKRRDAEARRSSRGAVQVPKNSGTRGGYASFRSEFGSSHPGKNTRGETSTPQKKAKTPLNTSLVFFRLP